MKKIYPYQIEGKHPDRVLDHIKHDIRKYLKRERRRPLPQGFDYWDFDCKTGTSADQANALHLSGVIGSVDALKNENQSQVFVEIIAKPMQRRSLPPASDLEDREPLSDNLLPDHVTGESHPPEPSQI
jgi:Family of unknown function (DUF6172)